MATEIGMIDSNIQKDYRKTIDSFLSLSYDSTEETAETVEARRCFSARTDIFTFPDALMAVVMGAAGVTARDNSGDSRSASNYVTSPQSHKRQRRQRVETKECTRCAAAAVAGRVVLLVAASPTQRYHLTRGPSVNYVRQVLL